MRIIQKHQSTQKHYNSHLEAFLNKDEAILIRKLLVVICTCCIDAGASVSGCSSDSVVSVN